jgi:single-stranded-DNA-specific exonuclease
MAAGFSLTSGQIPGFRRFLESQFSGTQSAYEEATGLTLDGVSSPAAAGRDLVAEIALAGPYGAGNPEPLLVFPDVQILFADVVGGAHVKLRLAGGDGTRLEAIAFRAAGTPLGEGLLKSRGRAIHVAGKLRTDDWNGQSRVQLQIEDAAASV